MKTLPFSRDQLHVSVSQVKAWLRCPRAFEFRYVLSADPEFRPLPLAFGSAIHEALATYYRGLMTPEGAPGVEAVVQAFRDAWELESSSPVPLQLAEDDDPGELVDHAAAMLGVFHRAASLAEPMIVEAVESPFEVSLYEPKTGEVLDESLVGVFDLVIEEDGNRSVVEHKSAARSWGSAQVADDIQLSAYSLAARELGWGDVGIRLQVLTKSKKNPAFQVENTIRGPSEEHDFLLTVVGVLRAIDAGVNFPIRTQWACKSCPYQTACERASRPPKLVMQLVSGNFS